MDIDRPSGTFDSGYGQSMAIVRTRLQWVLTIGFLTLIFTVPMFAGSYVSSILCLVGITIIAVAGINILTGLTGQFSMGQAAFMAVGAYSSAILTGRFGFSFWLALPASAVITALIGLIFGLPSVRIKGFYLAVTTLAAQFLIMWTINHVPDWTGGAEGMAIETIHVGNIALNTPQEMFYIIMPLCIFLVFVAVNITRSRGGRAFAAIRDNDLAAEVMGINIFRYKLISFFICSLYAGVAGVLWAYYMQQIEPTQFGLMQSILFMGMAIVGGLGSTLGSILGASFIVLLGELVNVLSPMIANVFPHLGMSIFTSLGLVVYGLMIVLFLIFEPRGLAHRWTMLKHSYRFWPFSY